VVAIALILLVVGSPIDRFVHRFSKHDERN
jgi:hypothetical protein